MPWTRLCRIEAESVSEMSGLAVSRRNPGVLWANDDSGDGPRLYALDAATGRRRATLTLDGAKARDWECLALDNAGRLMIGDTGDNDAKRKSITLYRAAEPSLPPGQSESRVPCEALTLTYPTGAVDCETLLVHPKTGATYLVTKVLGGVCDVNRVPDDAWRRGRAQLVRGVGLTLPMADGGLKRAAMSSLVTDGALAPDLSAAYLLTYAHLLRFAWPKGKPLEAAFASAPTVESIPKELKQAESLAFGPDGRLYVSSEGKHAPIFVR